MTISLEPFPLSNQNQKWIRKENVNKTIWGHAHWPTENQPIQCDPQEKERVDFNALGLHADNRPRGFVPIFRHPLSFRR